jgi:ribosome-binding factor A
MSTHAEQVASVIHRTVQQLLARGLNDPRIQGLVSVTDVKVTDDMTEASISISVIPEDRGQTTLKGLQSATGHIQGHIGRALSRRRIPRIRFRLDDSLKKQARIYEAINRTKDEHADNHAVEE